MLILVGILGSTFSAALIPSSSFQLQASRDQVVTAFFAAQQRAMVQTNPVRLVISGPTSGPVEIDILEDTDGDGDFTDESSLRLGGTAYPLELLPSQRLTSADFNFNRLGQTSSNDLVLSQGPSSVNILVSSTGYIR